MPSGLDTGTECAVTAIAGVDVAGVVAAFVFVVDAVVVAVPRAWWSTVSQIACIRRWLASGSSSSGLEGRRVLPWLISLMARLGDGSAFATRVVDCAVIGADSRRVLKFVGVESAWCVQELRAGACAGADPGPCADAGTGATFAVRAGTAGGVAGAADVVVTGACTGARADDEAADEGTVDLLASSAETSCDMCLSVRVSWSSSSLTSFQEHLACFFVHPMHAVRFFKQSIWRRRQRSHGGRIRSPRCSSSIRATISILCGPPSSFSG